MDNIFNESVEDKATDNYVQNSSASTDDVKSEDAEPGGNETLQDSLHLSSDGSASPNPTPEPGQFADSFNRSSDDPDLYRPNTDEPILPSTDSEDDYDIPATETDNRKPIADNTSENDVDVDSKIKVEHILSKDLSTQPGSASEYDPYSTLDAAAEESTEPVLDEEMEIPTRGGGPMNYLIPGLPRPRLLSEPKEKRSKKEIEEEEREKMQ